MKTFILFFLSFIFLCMCQTNRCPGDNEFYSCGGACDNVCATLHLRNQTNCPIVNVRCNDMCYCEAGYARNNNNVCVLFTPLCGKNEEYQQCKKTCPPDTCMSLVAKFKCASDPPCVPGCVCKSGYLRKKSGEPCVPIRMCPELENSPDFN